MLGGFWVSASALWIYVKIKYIDLIQRDTKAFIFVFTTLFLVGIVWEIFELLSHNTFVHTSNFWTDSLSDILNNTVGGALLFLYVILSRTHKNNLH